MLTLLYGRDAKGRQAALTRAIATALKEKKRVIWFVPEQQVLEAEGVMASFELSRFGEVSSFRRMANTVFRRFGGLRYHYIGNGAKQLVMWRALTSVSSSLHEYSNISLDDMATVRLLFDTVEELKLYCITPEDLERVAKETEDEKFQKKLSDISMIYAAYAALLSEGHDDAADDLARAASLCLGKNFFEGYHVFFDSFDGFTPGEIGFMRLLFDEAESVTITLAYDRADRRAFFSKLADTDRRLRKLAADTHRAVKEVVAEAADCNAEIAYFRDNFGKRLPLPYDGRGADKDFGIRAVACPGVYEEVRLVAADIKRRVMAGAHYRDFAIIARDSDAYLGVLDAALEGAGIPYFISSRRDVTAMSTARMLLLALDIHARFWRREDVIAFLRTGLSPLTAEECDAIEEYAEVWKISGKRWFDSYGWQMNPFGFSAPYDEKADERLFYLNTLREKLILPLTKLFEAFEGASTVKDISIALVHFLKEMKIGEKVSACAKLDEAFVTLRDSAENYLLLHDTLMKAFDELVEVVGDLKVTSHEYSRLFQALLREADMGTLPSRIDEVTVGNASLLRKNGIQHVYLIGLSEGEFPKALSDNGCFDNDEREALLLHGIETAPLASRRAEDEILYFYRAMTSATESVMMLYAYGNLEGKESFPSAAFLDTLLLLGEREEEKYDKLPIADLLYGAPEILEYAVLNGYDAASLGAFVGSHFALTTELDATNEHLSESVAKTLYGNKIRLSQSKTDSFSQCPFAYHCKYTLKLSEGARGQFDSLDIGNFIHEILEAFFSRFKDRVKEISDDEARAALAEILDDFSKRLTRDNKSKRFEGLVKRLRRTTELLCMNLLGEFRHSAFEPVLFEEDVLFSQDIPMSAESVSDTLTVVLSGVVDRADIFRVGDDVYLRVVDYKTGNKKFSMAEVEMGFQLQLLVYLFAMTQKNKKEIQKKIGCKGDILPAGALYFSLGAKAVSCTKMPEDDKTSRELIEKEIKRSGIFLNLPDVLLAMEEGLAGHYIPITLNKSAQPTKGRTTNELVTLEEMGVLAKKVSDILSSIARLMRKGEAAARPKTADSSKDPCQYCKMKPICRKRSEEEKGDEI